MRNRRHTGVPPVVRKGRLPLQACAIMVLAVYSVLSLSSSFPVFHHHGPRLSTACHGTGSCCSCAHVARADIPGSVASYRAGEVEPDQAPCPACQWQALVKSVAATGVPMPGRLPPRPLPALLSDSPASAIVMHGWQSRAPPLC